MCTKQEIVDRLEEAIELANTTLREGIVGLEEPPVELSHEEATAILALLRQELQR